MARRASKKTKPITYVYLVLGAGVIALGFNLVSSKGGKEEGKKLIQLDVSEYMKRGSMLRDNTYTLTGKVQDRFQRGDQEMLSVLVEGPNRKEDLLPVVVPPEVRSTMNLERGVEYKFKIKILNKGENLGIIIAENVARPE